MPWLPRAAALAAPSEGPSAVSPRLLQLLRTPRNPIDFPASILSGLSSTDPTIQRAAIAELRAYIRRLFFLDLDNYFQIVNLVTAGIIAVLIIIGIPVVLHRLYHGRLHMFRLERRAQGPYLIPNAINCFLLLEGLYGILTVAFNFVVWELFHNHMEIYVKLFQAFRSLVWIPLFCGAFLTGWGSLYTAPDTLDKPTASRHKTSAKGRLPWPTIVNLTCWGLPVVLIISLLPPVCLSSVQMTNAYNAYKDWDYRFESFIDITAANALINQAAVNDLRAEAYGIFTSWTRSYYYIDVGYVLWSFWAILFLVFYIPAGGVLVFLLYRQVNRQKAILLSCQRKLELQLAQEQKQAQGSGIAGEKSAEQSNRLGLQPAFGGLSATNVPSRAGAPLEDIYEDRGASNDSRATASCKSGHDFMGLDSALRQEPTASYQVHGAVTPGLASRLGHVASLAEELGSPSSADGRPSTSQPNTPNTPKPPSAFRRLIRIETSASSKGGQNSSSKRKRISITGGPMSRYKYLRRCLVNLLILYFGIISAAACFGAVTIYLAAVEYEHALKGPDSVAHSISVAGTTAALVSAVFGALTIGSIVFRNFDNPNPEASQGSDGGGGGIRRRFNRASKTGESGSKGGEGQEKTRTLPAVPESVDVEASLSMAQSRPHMAMDTSMKFAIADQGGFVIRPDDQLASMMSGNTPEDEMRGPWKGQPLRPPPAVRTWLGREREATMSIPQDVTESFGVASVPMLGGGSRQGEERFGTNDTTLAEYPADPRNFYEGGAQVSSSKAMGPSPRMRQEAIASSTTARAGSPRTRQEATSPPPIAPAGSPRTRQDAIAPSSTALATSPRMPQEELTTPASPVIKRQSRLSDAAAIESPASKIAREWAQAQYETMDLPQTPTTRGGRAEGTPTRPPRDGRRGGGGGRWI